MASTVSTRHSAIRRVDLIKTYELPMELEQINLFCLKPSTPLADIRSDGFSGDRHRMEHAVFRRGEDVFPERIRREELALQNNSVRLRDTIELESYSQQELQHLHNDPPCQKQ
jgi:hypothetical protein